MIMNQPTRYEIICEDTWKRQEEILTDQMVDALEQLTAMQTAMQTAVDPLEILCRALMRHLEESGAQVSQLNLAMGEAGDGHSLTMADGSEYRLLKRAGC